PDCKTAIYNKFIMDLRIKMEIYYLNGTDIHFICNLCSPFKNLLFRSKTFNIRQTFYLRQRLPKLALSLFFATRLLQYPCHNLLFN
ncbi:MAG: hypothetical protein ACK55Z_27460, partial [bacterium]